MRCKGKLKRKNIWIKEDQTFKERRIKWNLRRIAKEERREGRRIRLGYGKIWIEDRWWFWKDEREMLVDGAGRKRDKTIDRRGEDKSGR